MQQLCCMTSSASILTAMTGRTFPRQDCPYRDVFDFSTIAAMGQMSACPWLLAVNPLCIPHTSHAPEPTAIKL